MSEPSSTPPDAPSDTEDVPAYDPDERHPLARRTGEPPVLHRALLLFVAQHPERRAKTATARAVNRSESWVRKWAKKFEWDQRIRDSGTAGPSRALAIYEHLYMPDQGRVELACIEDRLRAPVLPDGVVNRGTSNADPATALEPPPAPLRSPGRKPGAKNRPRANPELAIVRKGATLIDAAIALAAKDLVSADAIRKMRVTAKDIPGLISARRRLERDRMRLESPEEAAAGRTVAVPESYRVRSARVTGGDVMGALADDVADLNITLQAIVNQRAAEVSVNRAPEQTAETPGG